MRENLLGNKVGIQNFHRNGFYFTKFDHFVTTNAFNRYLTLCKLISGHVIPYHENKAKLNICLTKYFPKNIIHHSISGIKQIIFTNT